MVIKKDAYSINEAKGSSVIHPVSFQEPGASNAILRELSVILVFFKATNLRK
jgi:hypothetical protein